MFTSLWTRTVSQTPSVRLLPRGPGSGPPPGGERGRAALCDRALLCPGGGGCAFEAARPCVLQVGERLGRYEVEKRCAVEKEDYDLAKEKKQQMEQFRSRVYEQLQLHSLVDAEPVGAWAPVPRAAETHLRGRRVCRVRM